jgi:transcriptional regulator GlxA family with amidase domain
MHRYDHVGPQPRQNHRQSTSSSIEQIATRVGFDSSVTYRHHFVRGMKTTPSGYRNCFTGVHA